MPEPDLPKSLDRIDIPVYLDAGIALSLAASLSRGVSTERSVQTEIQNELSGAVKSQVGIAPVASLTLEASGVRSGAVTENEVRKQTQESIFNAVRSALSRDGLIETVAQDWNEFEWEPGEFVEFSPRQIVVPLISAFERLRVIAESFAAAVKLLSAEALQARVPRFLELIKSEAEEDDDDDAFPVEKVLALLAETGELAEALVEVITRLEDEARASGLVDVIMFERARSVSTVIAVASLDREYVDTKLLRRLGQGEFSVLGKVLRAPEPGTAFNSFRNSMLGATNQFPVLLSHLTERLEQFPTLIGDGVNVPIDEEGNYMLLSFVGSASAIAELQPIWCAPTVEVLPVAIYA